MKKNKSESETTGVQTLGVRSDALNELCEAVPEVEQRVSIQKAEADGYIRVVMFARAKGVSEDRTRQVLVNAFRQGKLDRVKVGREYWYRAKKPTR